MIELKHYAALVIISILRVNSAGRQSVRAHPHCMYLICAGHQQMYFEIIDVFLTKY